MIAKEPQLVLLPQIQAFLLEPLLWPLAVDLQLDYKLDKLNSFHSVSALVLHEHFVK